MAADPTHTSKVYHKRGGDETVVANGGALTVESGGVATVESGGAINVESGGDIAVESGGTITPASGGVIDCTAATGSITFAAGEVDTADLAADAVTTAKITDANVTTAKIAALNVTTAKIAALNVTSAELASNAVTTAKITAANVTEPKLQLPTDDALLAFRIARATFDFAVDGGVVGAIGLGVTLPDNAIIVGGFYDVITTFTSPTTDAATLAISVEGANDIVTAVEINTGTPWDAGLQAIIPKANTPESTGVKTSGAKEITVTIAVEDITAGKFVLWLYYVVSD